MTRVLIATTAGLGHLLPLLRLGRALRAHGAEVHWVVGPSRCAMLAAEGFDVTPGGLDERPRFAEYLRRHPEAAAISGPEKRRHGFAHMFGGVAAPAMAPDLLAAAEEWRPDVVVRDAAELSAPLVAARLGVPCVVHAFGVPIPWDVATAVEPVLAPLWAEYGVPARPPAEYDVLYLDICPPLLDNGQAPPIPRRYVRPAEAVPAVPRDRPLVYVTFGTVFNTPDRLRAVVLESAAADVDVLVTIGADGDPAALGDLPPNVSVEGFVPQAEVLPRCSVVVSHGGSGTTFAALAHGVPNVLLPQGADQFENADRAAAAGAAVAFAAGPPPPGAITAAIRRVLEEPSYAAGAARVAAGIAAMPGPDEAAAAVAALR
ncbi:MAG TPA: nucleotide disphospho-sugar-binding domain-containing protein [Frankiaceae bacterium]|nr:nucleotide disphospho-sugar-binding domain-containing protein [Frankiaceae bacterium]